MSLCRTGAVFFSILFVVFFITSPAAAHVNMGGSKWFFGRDSVVATLELDSSSLSEVKGMKEESYSLPTCSEQQLQHVAVDIIQPYINRKLSVTVNGTLYPVKVDKIEKGSNDYWQIWLSIQKVRFDNPENDVKIDYRLLFEETGNSHVNIAYLYRPESVSDTARKTFSQGTPKTRYNFDSENPTWEFAARGLINEPSTSSVWRSISEFVLLGIKHILAGYDHIAFLLALIVVGLSIKEVMKIITAFTVAHSITLLLAALQIVSFNSRFVEIVIALSICYVALENLFRKDVNYRWLLTFAFGLIHGFGFASILQELLTGGSNLVPLILSFNIGVEMGQLMIFLVLLPVLYLLKSRFELRKVTVATSVAVFLLGFTWLLERAFDFKLL